MLVKGPYLQISNNYKRSVSIRELTEDLLSKKFLDLNTEKPKPDFVLYSHQTRSLDNIIHNDRSTVVSTGTGSGKTESFLIPILNHLMREEENGTLERKGVRALLIYPMNALVNDQIKRLRTTLKNYKKITFGAFTGETENDHKNALKEYKARFGYLPLDNELISREQMKESPPHILITNYAMLERILIKPENSVKIFSPLSNDLWKFIVLDEAHTYGGAKGTELSMLMRRIKATLENENIRFILTSATLGDENSNDNVADFANNLTGSTEFQGSDVIRAEYEPFKIPPGMVNGDKIGRIRNSLSECVKTVKEVSDETGYPEEEIVDLINTATATKYEHGQKIFDAKYHVFVRAIEGVYVSLGPSWKLEFTPSKTIDDNGTEYTAFQFSSCYNCGAVFIPGSEYNGFLKQVSDGAIEKNTEDIKDSLYFLCSEDDVDADYPEDFYNLCSKCGSLSPYFGDHRCECGEGYQNIVRKVVDDEEKLCTCPRCEQKNNKIGIARDFYLGSDAASSVLASALYHQLPGSDPKNEKFGGQFILFSDSRSGASYAAVNLEDTYKNILLHRAIYEAVRINPELFEEGITFDDLIGRIADVLEGIHGDDADRDVLKRDGAIALVTEASCNNSTKSLEFKGLFRFETRKKIKTFDGLSEEESKNLYNTLIKCVRDIGAVKTGRLNNDDLKEAVQYHSGIVKKNAERGKYDKVFLTKRMETYLGKVINPEKIDEFVNNFFEGFLVNLGKSYRLDLSDLKIAPSPFHYRCTKCQKHFPFSVKNVCPRCTNETLEMVESEFGNTDEHYSYLYCESPLIPLSIEEHTAQLSKRKATEYQTKFTEKKINALSCSTTFEMGIDIGDLETVFLRNVPPSPSNYIQRAGRAGRNADSSAFVLTFCKSASHDSHYFNNPEKMISGKVGTPVVNVNNPKIAIRHILASTFSFYWKTLGATPEDTAALMDSDYISDLYSYIDSRPPDLKTFLDAFVPYSIRDYRSEEVVISIDDFGWVECLRGEELGRLDLAKSVYDSDMNDLNDELGEATEKSNPIAGMIIKTINTLKKEDTLKFLSKNNILPKYGFPVDTVNLEDKYPYIDKEFELQRDLALAITEYAPGSQVIANKKLVTSEYIKVVKGKSWDRYAYSRCSKCQALTAERKVGYADKVVCEVCGHENDTSGHFLIPKFGFQYRDTEAARIYKPKKAHGTQYLYRGNSRGEVASFNMGYVEGSIQHNHDDELVAISNDKYFVCETCGYGSPIAKGHKKEHNMPSGKKCSTFLKTYNLGHIFKTDVTVIHFDVLSKGKEEQLSVLYALIRGLCDGLEIEPKEVSGCLRPNLDGTFDYVLFDNTPGGAGYVKRVTSESLPKIIDSAIERLKNCDCGGTTGDCSCYSCLRDYYNQSYHDVLDRGLALRYLLRMKGMEE